MIIAIDGPAASGKGTLARRLADHYGLRHLDTGLTYRAVAAAMLAAGKPLDDVEAAVGFAKALDVDALDADRLGAHEIGEAASRISVKPEVRAALTARQRAFAEVPPGAVLDGRDIGTVVCPDALAKLFVTADAETRAVRRAEELAERGQKADVSAILADLKRRDERDSNRAIAPLTRAPDAHLLDTTEMDIETAFRAAVDIIDRARRKHQ
jgi:cytidylate kinase